MAVIVACGSGDDGATPGPTTVTADGGTSTPSPAAEAPEGFILFRDGLGDLVALDLRAGESYAYDYDITSEVILSAECLRDGSRIAFLKQNFNETDRQVVVTGADGTQSYSLPPGAQGIAWSPDGGRIAYVVFDPRGGYSLHMLDLATGESTLLAEGDGVAASPRWSHDGSRIAFHAPSADTNEIWLYDLESGAGPVQLTDGGGAFDPEWTPEGDSIIVSAVAADGSFQIFEVDPDTGEMSPVTDSSDIFKRLPRYSPGGEAIAYTGSIVVPNVSRDLSALHSFGVFLMDTDGSNERPLTADPRQNPGAGVDPFLDALLVGWCADGPWLDASWTKREATPTPALQ